MEKLAKDKDKLIKGIRDVEQKYNVKLLNDDLTFTDTAIRLLVSTGLYYAFKGFELVINIMEKEVK